MSELEGATQGSEREPVVLDWFEGGGDGESFMTTLSVPAAMFCWPRVGSQGGWAVLMDLAVGGLLLVLLWSAAKSLRPGGRLALDAAGLREHEGGAATLGHESLEVDSGLPAPSVLGLCWIPARSAHTFKHDGESRLVRAVSEKDEAALDAVLRAWSRPMEGGRARPLGAGWWWHREAVGSGATRSTWTRDRTGWVTSWLLASSSRSRPTSRRRGWSASTPRSTTPDQSREPRPSCRGRRNPAGVTAPERTARRPRISVTARRIGQPAAGHDRSGRSPARPRLVLDAAHGASVHPEPAISIENRWLRRRGGWTLR